MEPHALLIFLGLLGAAPGLVAGQVIGISTTLPTNLANCYTGTNYWPSTRLPNSLDNLIYIIEKIEAYFTTNPTSTSDSYLDAATLAKVILKRFQLNGIIDNEGLETKSASSKETKKQDIVFSLLEINGGSNYTFSFPENILDDREKCSLHFMLSTGVNKTLYFPSYQSTYEYTELPFYPRENGALYTGKYGTLSGGPLIAGIAASSVTTQFLVQNLLEPSELSSVSTTLLSTIVEPIAGATLAGEIAQSVILYAYPLNRYPVFGPQGVWNGTSCSTTFALQLNQTTGASDAELLGALDGMIIGYYLKNNFYSTGSSLKPLLSQVLRSYYGRGLQSNSMYACDRINQYSQLTNGLTTSAIGFAAVYQVKYPSSDTGMQFPTDSSYLGSVINTAIANFSATYLQVNKFACDSSVQDLACLTENDVFVVMDVSVTASYNNFQEQKNFIGGLIQRIGVYPNGSHIGIYSFSSSSREPIPFTTTDQNGGDIRCKLQWSNSLYSGSTDVPNTIKYIHEKLRTLKNKQMTANLAKVPGKVVIFIYLQSASSMSTEDVKDAMKELRAELPEVTTLAVGANNDALKNFVLNDKDIFVRTGEQLSYNLDQITKRLCYAPATLEYKDCRNPNVELEKQLIGEAFVYPNTYQWIGISTYTFNKTESDEAYLNFESKYGAATFCVARSIAYDAPTSECYETSETSPQYRYKIESICNNDNDCPWIYINAKMKSGSGTQKCAERACDSWNQVKVFIGHEGLKCGAGQILATIPILIMGFVFSWILERS